MIKEERFRVFIDSVGHFFNNTHHLGLIIDTPFLTENTSPIAYDYIGLIGITGPYKGCVYFTARQKFLKNLLLAMHEPDVSEMALKDLVGEVANTIAGNARSEYGEEFMISVPIVLNHAPSDLYLPKGTISYVIPMRWKAYQAAIVISLQDSGLSPLESV